MKEVFLVDDRLGNPSYINIFYGTGDLAFARLKEFLNLGIKIDYIADYDEKKWGTKILGISVLSHDDVCTIEKKNIIIGSLVYKNEIYTRLVEMGIPVESLFYDILPRAMNDSLVVSK